MRSKLKIIVGLGKTGISCARYLQKQGHSVVVMDTRSTPPDLEFFQKEFPDVPLYCGALSLENLLEADELIISPGVSLAEPVLLQAIKKIPFCGDIELFARAASAPIVGITGTNAKGTVTTLLGEMVKQADKAVLLGGNIGTPALELLDQPVPNFYVMELSSFQLETTFSLNPRAATILNLTPDHLDRHGTMEAYGAAKQRIYKNAEYAVWNRDDLVTRPSLVSPSTHHIMSFGFSQPQNENELGLIEENQETWLMWGDQKLINTDELRIKGRHNFLNAQAAIALGLSIHLPMPAMLAALRTFKGLTYRCEWVAEHKGVVWYDDSKGTNVGATLAALQGLGAGIRGKIVWIAGGLGKGAEFTDLRESIAQFVRTAILMGQDAPLIEKAIKDVVNVYRAGSLAEAVEQAKQTASAGDIVLLSPACASFDMFRDYEDRGNQFKQLVRLI